MLCYRIEAIGDEFEFMYVRFFGKIHRMALEPKSGNFHKRFHRFSLRRWMIFGLTISELPEQCFLTFQMPHRTTTNIDSQDLAMIMTRWRKMCGLGWTKIDLTKFENII